MFGLFKRQSEIENLQKKYAKAMKEWHRLSAVDRQASDKIYAEAENLAKQIDAIKNKNL
jgi:hypothetical protein